MQNVLTQKEKLKDSMEVMLIDVRVIMDTLEMDSNVPMKKQVKRSLQFGVISFKNCYYEIHNQFNNHFLLIGKLDLPSEGLQIELTMNLAPQIKIERTEKNFPIGKATTDFESQLKRMQAANDGKEVFCNGNSGRKYSWNETAY